jgi:hypothetical protein
MKRCVKCDEKIQLGASMCRYCSNEQPLEQNEKPKSYMPELGIALLFVILLIVVVSKHQGSIEPAAAPVLDGSSSIDSSVIIDEKLLAQSDDFALYHAQFAGIASKLIAAGRCTEAEFQEQGGFTKSVTLHRTEPVYFVYCGGMSPNNKIYVNGDTGSVVQ